MKIKEENFVYRYGGDIYINLTNRCSNDCSFCLRNHADSVGESGSLWLKREPSAEEVIGLLSGLVTQTPSEALKNGTLNSFRNIRNLEHSCSPTACSLPNGKITFCGYGEPTYRLNELLEVSAWCKKNNIQTKLNTNGHGNLINNKNIVPLLKKVIDVASISLNSSSENEYNIMCKPIFENGYRAMLEFASLCVKAKIKTILSIVGGGSEEVKAARLVAEDLGAEFRLR